MEHIPSRTAAYGYLASAMLLVGCYIALSKPLALTLPVFLLAWMRFGCGGIAMLHWLKKPAREPALTRQTKQLLFLQSFIGNFLFSLCMITGIRLTSAVSAGVIMSSIPAVVALMSWILLKERIGPRIWAAAFCGALGIGLLSLAQPSAETAQAHATGNSAWLGDALIFCAVLCESFYSVAGKKLSAVLSPKRICALINLWGFLLMTPFGLYAAMRFDFAAVAGGIWVLLVFYAWIASVVTVWLWMTGQKSVSAAQAGVFCVLLPIGTVLTGVLALGESLNGGQILALVIALGGIALATVPGKRRASAPATLDEVIPLSFDTTAANKLRHRFDGRDRVWLFGYGSLIFKADFPFIERRPASIHGWTRRFWQGSHDHRGTPAAPGRVATLTPQTGAVCAGMAYLITPDVFDHLDHREKNGYLRRNADIVFADGASEPGLLYIAAEDNAAFLGPASEHDIARQIAAAVGPSGRNRDYVTDLAAALRLLGQEDPHVFEIERCLIALTIDKESIYSHGK